MSNNSNVSVDAPVMKVATAWMAAIGIASWSDFAAMLAAFYSLLLIFEWFWKKFWRPFLEDRGYIKRIKRRSGDEPDEDATVDSAVS